jgi:phage FluMu protein Com
MFDDSDYDKAVMRASDFIPGGYIMENGEKRTLSEASFHAVIDEEPIPMLFSMPVKACFDECPRCKSDSHEDGFIAVFEGHLLMPCWECKSIVILTNEEADEITPDWRRELL